MLINVPIKSFFED